MNHQYHNLYFSQIQFDLYLVQQPIQILNFFNEIFVHLLFEYIDKLKILNSDKNTPKRANSIGYTKSTKTHFTTP